MGIYEHYKGVRYQVIGTATHTETGEILVIYQKHDELPSKHFFARPKSMFFDEVEVNGELIPRFKFLYLLTI